MRLLAIILLVLLGCAGNRSVEQSNVASDDPKCKEIAKFTPELKEMSKQFVGNEDLEEFDIDGNFVGKVFCVETIKCEEENYCISYKSSAKGLGSFFDPIHHE